MTGAARVQRLRRRLRSQQGFTLLEVMLTAAISAIIAIPVLAWMLTGFKVDLLVRSNSERTGLTTQITQTFPRDVSAAQAVRYTTVDGAMAAGAAIDCADAQPTDELMVSLLSSDGTRLTAYVVTRSGNTTTLIRRTCLDGQPANESDEIGTSTQNNGVVTIASAVRTGGAYGPGVNGVDVTFDIPSAKPITVSGSLRGGVDP